MKNKISILLSIILFLSIKVIAQCPNGDAEFGSFTNWTGYTGMNTSGTLNLSSFTPGIVSGIHDITNSGTYDPIVGGTILPTVHSGSHAIRLGNSTAGGLSAIASYTFVVTAANQNLSFKYAMVMEGYHPNPADNCFFQYWVSKTNVLSSSISPANYLGGNTFMIDPTNSWYMNIEGQTYWKYKPWQTECFHFESNMIGQTVTIYFASAKCKFNVHGAYIYIDELCKPNLPTITYTIPSSVCDIHDLIVDGTGSNNYEEYWWEIRNFTTGTPFVVFPHVIGPITLPFNIGDAYTAAGNTLTSGNYEVRLHLKNCAREVRKDTYVQVDLPQINSPDKFYACCDGSGGMVTLNAGVTRTSVTGQTLKWYDKNYNYIGSGTITSTTGGGNSTIQSTISVHTSSYDKFLVEYRDDNGCLNNKWVYAISLPKIVWTIKNECINNDVCGNRKLIANIKPLGPCDMNNIDNTAEYEQLWRSAYNILWSTGQTSVDIMSNSSIQTYSATVSSPCTTSTQTITVPSNPFPGGVHALWVTTSVHPGYSNFVVFDNTLPTGTIPAYNAKKYRLQVFNRWGNTVYDSGNVYTCNGFFNGEIRWDCITTPSLDLGTYDYLLDIESCDANTTSSGQFEIVY